MVGAIVPGTAVAGAAAVDLAAIGQGDEATVGEVGTILGAIALDDDHATDFEVFALPSATAEGAGTGSFDAPAGDLTGASTTSM